METGNLRYSRTKTQAGGAEPYRNENGDSKTIYLFRAICHDYQRLLLHVAPGSNGVHRQSNFLGHTLLDMTFDCDSARS